MLFGENLSRCDCRCRFGNATLKVDEADNMRGATLPLFQPLLYVFTIPDGTALQIFSGFWKVVVSHAPVCDSLTRYIRHVSYFRYPDKFLTHGHIIHVMCIVSTIITYCVEEFLALSI